MSLRKLTYLYPRYHSVLKELRSYCNIIPTSALLTISYQLQLTALELAMKDPRRPLVVLTMPSALMHPDIVNASIKSELDKGRIKELTDLPKHYFCSPIGLTPKNVNGAQTG